jgi:oxalate decarboxylase/phosphoglucose isomerase-like protein (cupin superfamily)
MQTIKHKNQILAIIYRDQDWVEGLNFITPNELFVQVGSWWYNKGRKLASHVHNDFERSAMRTQEMTYVKKGSMRVLLYDEQQNYLQDFVLYEGDLAVFAYGGHGYEILEDNTKIIEAKNGPFVDVETDKTKF